MNLHQNTRRHILKTADYLRSALFWGITEGQMGILSRRFATTYRSLEDGTDTLSRNDGK
jgi:hypothetical protein